jgi:alpha-tubulin suppressor-like RCC1 family protein
MNSVNLGFPNIIASNKPKYIKLKKTNKTEIKIDKISCGQVHNLLISSYRDIYGFGDNECGKLE